MPYPKRDGIPMCLRPAVYKITNKATDKVYVGSSINARSRLKAHRSCLRRGKHDNSKLQRSWDHWGERYFAFDILETCRAEDRIAVEQKWIDSLACCNERCGYNMCPVAGGGRKGFKHTLASRQKMSESTKGQDLTIQTRNAAIANRGRRIPPEVLAKRSIALKGKKRTEEQKANIKKAHWSKGPNAKAILERIAAFNRGKKHTEEHKKKISRSLLKYRTQIGRSVS